ncbi:MAG: ABC transporter ATP-binding protein [Peptostreptococcaceae bacterium]|nr:ABC transporter ATP-binding protein [Peptostreptococcaceae bacterium]
MTNNTNNDQQKIAKQDIRRLMDYALGFPKNLSLGILLLFAAAGFELLAPFAVRKIFDEELKRSVIDQAAILRLIGLYLLANFAGVIFKYGSSLQLQIMAMRIVQRMRMQIYKNLQRIHISFFDNMPAGSIVSKITNDTEAVQGLYVRVIGKIVTSLLYIIGIYAVLFAIQPGLAAWFLLLIPTIYGILAFYQHLSRRFNHVIRTKISELNGTLNEVVQGISIIQAFNSQEKVRNEFDRANQEQYNERIKMLKLNSATSYNITRTIKSLVFVLFIFYFGNKVVKNDMITSVGMLYVYVDYIMVLFDQIHSIMEEMNEMSKSGVASSHVFEMIDKAGKEVSSERLKDIHGNVEFRDVSFAYKDDEYVLKNINIKAEKGQTIALVGHTGSGKSSIMNLLLKFYEPQQGEILVDQMALSELPDQAIRDQMGIVLQEPYLFTGTVLSNITLNKPEISREAAEKALEMVGGDVVIRNLTNGIDEKVVERGATLSSGQRQLISFARALAQDPRILILDEATSSVDSETEQIIQQAMDVLMRGRTTFVIAHRLSTIKNADKIYLLEKGKVIEQGDHEELIARKGKYYEMYETQSRVMMG